jgi:hypothetical protein
MSRSKRLKNALWLLCIENLFSCSYTANRPASDHFDGMWFFNPTLSKRFSPGISDIWRMVREGRKPWPKSAEKKGVPQLDAGPKI